MESGSTFTIETGVDKLVKFLKGRGNVPLTVAAKEIGVSTKVIETWATFLMEEKILGIDYKFTTPYIYLIEENSNDDLNNYKTTFKNSHSNSISKEQVDYKWKSHLMEVLNNKKDFFYKEASKRGLKNIDNIWIEYKAKVTNI